MPQPMFLCVSRPKLFTGSENPVVDDIYILSESQPHCPPLPRPQCDLNILDNLDKTGSHLKKRIMERITSSLDNLISILTYFILSLDVCRRIYVWWTDGGSLLVFVICVDKERIILKPFIGTVTDHYVTSKHGSLGQGMRDIRYIWEYSAALLFETFYWIFSNFSLRLYRNFTLVDNVDQLLKICKSLTVNS